MLNRSNVRFVTTDPLFTFSVDKSFSKKKIKKKFMMVTSFNFRFDLRVKFSSESKD